MSTIITTLSNGKQIIENDEIRNFDHMIGILKNEIFILENFSLENKKIELEKVKIRKQEHINIILKEWNNG